MKKTRFTEEQIMLALHRAEEGTSIEEISCKLRNRTLSFLQPETEVWRLTAVGSEKITSIRRRNKRLKQLVVVLSLDKHILQDILSKKL